MVALSFVLGVASGRSIRLNSGGDTKGTHRLPESACYDPPCIVPIAQLSEEKFFRKNVAFIKPLSCYPG